MRAEPQAVDNSQNHSRGGPALNRTRHHIASVAIALIGLAPVARAADDRAEKIFHDARAYTVRVRTQITDSFLDDERGSFSGAGFYVDAQRGWVVTNAHVVGHCPSTVTVAFADGSFHPARKIYVDSFTDVAVLELAASERHHPVAPLNGDDMPRIGEAIGVFGHPLGMLFTGSRGIVSGKTDQLLNDLLQVDATVDHGNSGGPVISLRDGRIVGIATSGAGGQKSDRINFATPMKDVCRILELLRQGVAPDPPQMEFSLLVDEDGHHTLDVGRTYDATRWPFEPGDHVVAIGTERRPVHSITEMVTALRGTRGPVPVIVKRDDRTVAIAVDPALRPAVLARRGVVVDGAVIAPVAFEDATVLAEPARLVVQSIEPGSPAEAVEFGRMDMIQTIDGRAFESLDELIDYLGHRHGGGPLRIVFQRFTDSLDRWFEFHVRELPGDELRVIGPDARLLSATP